MAWHLSQPAASQESPQLTGKEREAEAKREQTKTWVDKFFGVDPTGTLKTQQNQQSNLNFGATKNDTGQMFEVLFFFSALFFQGSIN